MQDIARYTTLLSEFGLHEREARIYLSCLKLGQASAGEISEDSGLQRTYVYIILQELFDKSLVSEVEIRGKKVYSAVSIEHFKEIQINRLARLEATIPELKALQLLVSDRPKVRFYEGREGIFAAQQETLELPRGGEVLAYATAEGLYKHDPEFAIRGIGERVKRGIRSRALAADTEETRKYTDEDKKQLRTTRLVPADKYPFTNEINIWANKVSIMSMQGELSAVVIESESVASTQRTVFELAWLGASTFEVNQNKE